MIRLFHVSDVHFGAEDREAIAWFDAAVHAERPDAIIITGDLTMRAKRREFAAACRWIEALDRPVTIEPGNHDLPLYNLFRRFTNPYKRFDRLEAAVERPLTIAGVTVVPLRTTKRFQWRNWAKGSVSDSSLAAAERVLADTAPQTLAIVACHHPLIEAGTRATARTHKGAPALERLARAGADIVLSGHVHDPFDVEREVGGRRMRLIGAGTLSERVRDTPPGFNELRVAGDAVEVLRRALT